MKDHKINNSIVVPFFELISIVNVQLPMRGHFNPSKLNWEGGLKGFESLFIAAFGKREFDELFVPKINFLPQMYPLNRLVTKKGKIFQMKYHSSAFSYLIFDESKRPFSRS